MSNINDGGQAYPTARVAINGETAIDGVEGYGPGMSLRDYFAGQALLGILSAGPLASGFTYLDVASGAYMWADAMIAARSQSGESSQ